MSEQRPEIWIGWHRPPGGLWRQLVRGDTKDGTMTALLEMAEHKGLSGGLVVLPGTEVPWKPMATNEGKRGKDARTDV